MLKYVLKRVLMLIPVVFGISLIIFFIMSLTPGDPALAMLGDDPSPEVYELLRKELGLNDPIIVRYFKYILGALQGDLGTSYKSGLPVIDEIRIRLPYTLRLALISTTFAVIVGIPIGILSAVKQYSLLDTTVLGTSLILTSLPGFFFGLILILIFSVHLHLLPMMGMDSVKAHILPCLAACTGTLASMIRMTRSTMLEVIRQDYIRTARAKGVPERKIIFKHALKNSLLPVITIIGLHMGLAMGGSIAIEHLFSITGIGQLMITAIRQKDTPVVMACIMMTALIVSVSNLLVDILYYYVDPRLKTQVAGNRKRVRV